MSGRPLDPAGGVGVSRGRARPPRYRDRAIRARTAGSLACVERICPAHAARGSGGPCTHSLAEHPSEMPTRVVAHTGGAYSVAAQWSWVRRARAAVPPGDVIFFPHWDAPMLARPTRTVMTVHDVTPLQRSARFSSRTRAAGRLILGRALTRPDAVICVSPRRGQRSRPDVPARGAARVRRTERRE